MVAAFPMLHWSLLSFLTPRAKQKASLAEQSCCKVQELSFLWWVLSTSLLLPSVSQEAYTGPG